MSVLTYCGLFLIWFSVIYAQTIVLNGNHIPRLQKSPTLSTRIAQNNWILQQLDNFDTQNSNTWYMQYFYNDENYVANGPIFIYVGGQKEAYDVWLRSGQMYDIAKDLGAMMFATEHRYFGLSIPTADLSLPNLKYLSSDQALADLAVFVRYIKTMFPQLANSRVILFGSNYGATLATWFRQKYPQYVDGVWASSAPLLADNNFMGYYPFVSATIFNIGGEPCYRRIERAFVQMGTMIQNGQTQTLQTLFSLSTPIDNTDPLEIASFFNIMALSAGSYVEYTDSPSIIQMCNIILDPTYTDDVAAFAEFMDYLYGDEVVIANGFKYLASVFGSTDLTSQGAVIGARQMLYLYCTQFGYWRTTDFVNQGFGNKITLDSFVQMCTASFGTSINALSISADINRTNTIFGGLNPDVTNVYFTNGGMDPFSVEGLTTSLNSLAPAVVIPLVGKSYDLFSTTTSDSPELKAAKDMGRQLVNQWIKS